MRHLLLIGTLILATNIAFAQSTSDTITIDLTYSFLGANPQGSVLLTPVPDEAKCTLYQSTSEHGKVYDCGVVDTRIYLFVPNTDSEHNQTPHISWPKKG